jgi:hypothetical protein
MNVTSDSGWWERKWYNVVFDYTQWTPEVHSWFMKRCPGGFRRVPLTGGNDCVYMFENEGDAITFKLTFPERCRSGL